MKKKNSKSIILLVLLLVLSLTLVACGSTESSTDSPSTTSETSSSENTQEEITETTEKEEPSMSYEITDTRNSTWVNSIGTTWMQTIVEITNTGSTNLYLSSGSYDLEDANGGLIASRSMVSTFPDVIAPGEKGYMYEEATLDDPVDGELTVLPREDVEEAKIDLIRFPVTDIKISAGD